jgi:hypothetical protein
LLEIELNKSKTSKTRRSKYMSDLFHKELHRFSQMVKYTPSNRIETNAREMDFDNNQYTAKEFLKFEEPTSDMSRHRDEAKSARMSYQSIHKLPAHSSRNHSLLQTNDPAGNHVESVQTNLFEDANTFLEHTRTEFREQDPSANFSESNIGNVEDSVIGGDSSSIFGEEPLTKQESFFQIGESRVGNQIEEEVTGMDSQEEDSSEEYQGDDSEDDSDSDSSYVEQVQSE